MKKIISALVTCLLMLVNVAKAEELKEGVNYKFTLGGQNLFAKLYQLKNGVAVVETMPGKYLTAASSEDGAAVNAGGTKDGATKWKLIDNGAGMWNFVHADNGANALCMGGVGPKGDGKATGVLTLRRNNAGGAGNKDQLWKFEGAVK
jgi:hypothetical protein